MTSNQKSRAERKRECDLALDTCLFAPGDRVCVAVSGGADSTALLRCLVDRREELGIVLSVLHVEHGLRGKASLQDAAFVAGLATQLGLPFEAVSVETMQRVAEKRESIETAARVLRYEAFRQVLERKSADVIATAHTLDDQAETVLMKLIRGAWTEGLSGIHPVLYWGETMASVPRSIPSRGPRCIRPFLAVSRAEIEEYLQKLGQPWCEDETNRSLVLTRNRIRHELLPLLRTYNPQISHALSHVAANARAEEQHWQIELDRVLPLLLLPGLPVRGGGRSAPTDGEQILAMEIARLRELDPGLQRRVLRAAVERLGSEIDFDSTERLLRMVAPSEGRAPSVQGKKLELPGGLRVNRSARELRLTKPAAQSETLKSPDTGGPQNREVHATEYTLPIPGAVDAPFFGSTFAASLILADHKTPDPEGFGTPLAVKVRTWLPGDRIELQHTRGPKKVKEILNRMRIPAEQRSQWPVVARKNHILWMRGVQAKPVMIRSDGSSGTTADIPDGYRLEIHETRTQKTL